MSEGFNNVLTPYLSISILQIKEYECKLKLEIIKIMF